MGPALDLLATNLLSPVVLAFGLGLLARGLRSDLEIHPAIQSYLSIFLLLAIGLKGGVALHHRVAGPHLPVQPRARHPGLRRAGRVAGRLTPGWPCSRSTPTSPVWPGCANKAMANATSYSERCRKRWA